MRYPVMLDVAREPVLVVGAGPIAARKVRDLVACGALVTVVAVRIGEQCRDAGAATLEERPYRAGEAARYRLVVTATGVAAVDGQVASDARAAGVWVNSADDPANCTFILPAVLRRGPVTLTVSTEGTSPALAGWLRDRLGDRYGPELTVLADRLGAHRRELLERGDRLDVAGWAELIDSWASELGV